MYFNGWESIRFGTGEEVGNQGIVFAGGLESLNELS